jgi:hypothetical protein
MKLYLGSDHRSSLNCRVVKWLNVPCWLMGMQVQGSGARSVITLSIHHDVFETI